MRYCNVCGVEFNPVNNSQIYCSKECVRKAKNERQKRAYETKFTKHRNKGRYSGKEYENTFEKLQAIKEKYKNGVTIEHIKAMF